MFDREKWMLAQSILGVIRAANAPYCSVGDEQEAINIDNDYIGDVASMIAVDCSRMQLESMIQILECALDYSESLVQAGAKKDFKEPR